MHVVEHNNRFVRDACRTALCTMRRAPQPGRWTAIQPQEPVTHESEGIEVTHHEI